MSTTEPLVAPGRTGRHANTSLVILFLSMAGLSFAVLQSLVAPALPAIAGDLNSTVDDISWTLTAYLLASSVLTPILGRLGDMVGKRRVLLGVLVGLAIGTLICALSTTLPVLIAGRAIQGVAGGILPLSIGIVRDELPRERVSVTVGLLSAIFGIGGGLGIVLAGPIVDHLAWEYLFWLPLVLILAALVGIAVGVPESPLRTPGRLDLVGATILSVALVALLLAISKGSDWGWGSGSTIGLFLLGAIGLVMFAVTELRVREPLIDMRLLAIRGVWTTNVVGLVFGFGLFGTFLLIPTLLELPAVTGYGFGKSVTAAGLYLLPSTLVMLVAGPLAGVLDRRYGPKLPLVLGALFLALGFAVPALSHSTGALIILCGLITGAGTGLALSAMSNAIIEVVPAAQTGEATSVNSIVRTVGGGVGAAVVAAVITANSTAQGLPLDKAFTLGFWTCAGVGVLGVLAALAMPASRRR